MHRLSSLLTCALMTILVVPAVAEDLNPPDYRSAPRSTTATWDFYWEQGRTGIQPDANVWAGDAATLLRDKFPAGGSYPSASLFGDVAHTHALGGAYAGGSRGDGGVVFVVPNWVESEPGDSMRLRLQVTYEGSEPPTTVIGYLGIPGANDVKEIPIKRVPFVDSSEPPGSAYFYEDWIVSSSPTWEQVVVFVPPETLLLQVIIDTVIDSRNDVFGNGFEPGDISPWSDK